MAAAHQQGAKQSQKDAQPSGTTLSEENCMRYSSDQCLIMLLAPGHPTPRQTFRKLNKCSVPQLVLSLVTIGELQVSLPCVLTSCGIHYTLDVASEMPLCFITFTMDKFASVGLPSLSQQMLALDATTSINSEQNQPPASPRSY